MEDPVPAEKAAPNLACALKVTEPPDRILRVTLLEDSSTQKHLPP